MIFTEYDLKPSHRVYLKYSQSPYLLLKNGRLANIETGECELHIKEQFDIVRMVENAEGEILAVRVQEGLQKYDVTQHDDKIVKIKRRNKLISYDEMVVDLMRRKIHHSNLLLVKYKKVKGSYKTDTGEISCPTYKGQVFKANQSIKGTTQKINLEIVKYLVDKKNGLYLYRYTAIFNFLM